MANRNLPTYYLVEADMLPEIFLKVMEAKERVQHGRRRGQPRRHQPERIL